MSQRGIARSDPAALLRQLIVESAETTTSLYVADMDQALARLKKADAKLLGETPVSLGGKTQLVVVRDPDGNFIELIGPTKD